MRDAASCRHVTRQSTFYAMWGGIDGVGFLCYGRPEKAVSCLPARPRVARGNLRGLESRAVLREPFAGGRTKLLPFGPFLRAEVFGHFFGPEREAGQGSLRARPQRVPSRLVGKLLHGYLPIAVDPCAGRRGTVNQSLTSNLASKSCVRVIHGNYND